MLKPWHRDDIFAAQSSRGWSNPVQLEVSPDWYAVGEAWTATRLQETLKMFFVSDYGTGYKGIDSIESVSATVGGTDRKPDLWLHRRRDSKWKAALSEWVAAI